MATKQSVWLDLERFRDLREELSDIDKVIRKHINEVDIATLEARLRSEASDA